MYTAHFGLREAPFGITPDTSFFFGSPHSQEALNTLLVAARGGEGFIKITGTDSCISQYSYYMRLYFKNTTRYIDHFFCTVFQLHTNWAWLKQGDQWRMAG